MDTRNRIQKEPPSPELTIWSSLGYNPIATGSSFSNETAGDRTVNANLTVAFRMRYFTWQNTGFYRDTIRTGFPNFNSWGYAEQGGYYIVPGKFEFARSHIGSELGSARFPGSQRPGPIPTPGIPDRIFRFIWVHGEFVRSELLPARTQCQVPWTISYL